MKLLTKDLLNSWKDDILLVGNLLNQTLAEPFSMAGNLYT